MTKESTNNISVNYRALIKKLPFCLSSDRHRIQKEMDNLKKGSNISPERVACLQKWVAESTKTFESRRLHLPEYHLDKNLPIFEKHDIIIEAIKRYPLIIVCGETGSGKTTQLPLCCLQAGRGISGFIGHTQPRRIAARSIAQRLSSEMQQSVGEAVGYQVRFHDKTKADSYIKVMTDGILLAEIHQDPYLSKYDTLIIDEAHERSLNIDFLLGYIKRLIKKRADLKVIVTSATIDAERFSTFFNQAPVIEVSGRTYPVEIRYRDVESGDSEDANVTEGSRKKNSASEKLETPTQVQAISQAIDEACSEGGEGDILIFLPGEREIRETAEYLRKHHLEHTKILPLYARQSTDEQKAVFEKTNARKIILATNVAETSLTIPGIRFVIDTGYARIKRYSHRRKIEQLRIEKISKASANQRAGRCGRVAAGICFRLYDKTDYELRPDYTDPEVLRSSLAAIILKMSSLGFGHIERFDFIDKPWPKMVSEGYRLLTDMGAINAEKRLTPLGKQMARLPLDPKIARILLEASDRNCLSEMLIICSALSVQDPREFPLDNRQAAEMAHRRFYDNISECFGWVNLWQYVDELIAHKKSNKKLMTQLRSEFLSYLRIREWRDVHSQLLIIANESKWKINQASASIDDVLISLISGFLGHVGIKTEDNDYQGVHGLRFLIHPSSSFKKRSPKWMVAAEITETSKLYVRQISEVTPEHIEAATAHLLSKQYIDPHWVQNQGKVVAFERLSLYGLVVVARRPVHFGPIDPVLSRQIFIRSALVEGEYQSDAAFWKHNQKIISEIEQMEHRARRQDILADDEMRYCFYDEKIPEDITQKATFEKWRKAIEKRQPDYLFFDKQSLMRHSATQTRLEWYPTTIRLGSVSYKLSYWHEPGSFRDGVTLTLPVSYLNQIPKTDWPVAGFLKAKVEAICKALPQRYRAHLIPLPAFVDDFMQAYFEKQCKKQISLVDTIIAFAKRERKARLPKEAFDSALWPDYLNLNYKLIDEFGKQMDMSRDLDYLRQAYGHQAEEEAIINPYEGQSYTSWSFGDLPKKREVMTTGGRKKQMFIGLTDQKMAVSIDVFDHEESALASHRVGLNRLAQLVLNEQMRYFAKELIKHTGLYTKFSMIGAKDSLEYRFLFSIVDRCFLSGHLFFTEADFQQAVRSNKSSLATIANQTIALIEAIVTLYQQIRHSLKHAVSFGWAKEDIEEQLAELVSEEFWLDVDQKQLTQYPRYLEAILLRIQKLAYDPKRDEIQTRELQKLLKRYDQRYDQAEDDQYAQLTDIFWQIQELRVSLFAQSLKTAYPVSIKRIEKALDQLRR